jgi:hypothetical protein
MKLWTYAELKSKVELDLSTEDELFIQPSELLGYFNEAIDQAEQDVLGLYEDYFLTRATLALVAGTEEYSLPSDIYAEKIRRVIFRNGTELYPIARIRDWKKFEVYSEAALLSTTDRYSYFLYNPSAGQSKLLLVPVSRDTGNYVTIWYIRNVEELVDDSDILEIPEAANFVLQYVKVRIMEKEGHFALPKAVEDLERERELLKSTLANMVPDADNEIEMDTSMYEEMN